MQRGQEQDGEMGDTLRVRDLEEAGEKKALIVIGANNLTNYIKKAHYI